MVAKNKIFALGFFLSFILIITMASAAVTIITPSAAGTTVTGSYTFNLTTNLANAVNCTWATTADGVFNVTTNDTASDTVFNVTIDTTSLTDAEDTTLTTICTNTSSGTQQTTLLINVDNTNPVCSFTIDRNVVEFQDGIGITTTQGSTDTTDLTYAWTLYRGDGTTSTTSTSASPSFSGSNFDQIDEFTLGLTVTDEASKSSSCTNQSIIVKGANGEAPVAGITTFIQENKTMMILLGATLFILLVAIAGFFIISHSKK